LRVLGPAKPFLRRFVELQAPDLGRTWDGSDARRVVCVQVPERIDRSRWRATVVSGEEFDGAPDDQGDADEGGADHGCAAAVAAEPSLESLDRVRRPLGR
jgi:hypothetical protein